MNHFLSADSRAIIALHFKDFFQLFLFSKLCTRPLFLFSGDIAETQRFALETMRRVVAMVSKCFNKSEKKSFEVEIGQTIRDQMMSILPWILKPFNIFVSAVFIKEIVFIIYHSQQVISWPQKTKTDSVQRAVMVGERKRQNNWDWRKQLTTLKTKFYHSNTKISTNNQCIWIKILPLIILYGS